MWKFWKDDKQPDITKKLKIDKSLLSEPPSNEELKSWKSEVSGKYFKSLLLADYEDLKDSIVEGVFTTETADGTAQQIAKAIGMAEKLRDVIDILEDFGNNEEDEKK